MFSTAAPYADFSCSSSCSRCAVDVHPRASRQRRLFPHFLNDGTTLVSYGEFARVARRVVFSVPLGECAEPRLQLLSIPDARRLGAYGPYAAAVRARHYADTRGEQDLCR